MFKRVGFLLFSLMVIAQSAMAAILPADEAAIKAGLTSADTVFYSIGGALLVVMAGIWGFKRVKALL